VRAHRSALGIQKFDLQRRPWTAEQDALLGVLSDEEVARRLNRTLESIKVRRGRLRIPMFAQSAAIGHAMRINF
jgi:precorrin-6x reductase